MKLCYLATVLFLLALVLVGCQQGEVSSSDAKSFGKESADDRAAKAEGKVDERADR